MYRLFDKCTELYIDFVNAQLERVPGAVNVNMHDTWWPPGLGTLCEDDLIVTISPETLVEFVVPYWNRISEEFGGIMIHSCGEYSHLFETMRDNVHELRGIWMNTGENSFEKAVAAFRGTDTVIIPRWVINKSQWYGDRVDFVKRILAQKDPDVSVFLQAHYFNLQRMHDPDVDDEPDQNAVGKEILRVIEKYVAKGVVD